jgi:hypothetical protein
MKAISPWHEASNRLSAVALVLIGMAGLVLWNGCESRPPSLRIKAQIDGKDVVMIRGDKLWFEHESWQLPDNPVYINGKAWDLQWNGNVSEPYAGVSPAFRPGGPARIRISKLTGRGPVSITQTPNSENNDTLAITFDDEEFGGADWYEIVVSWEQARDGSMPPPETSFNVQQAAATNQVTTDTIRGMQTELLEVDDYRIVADWSPSEPPGLMTVSIYHPREWGIRAGDVTVRVFDNRGREVQCEPSPPGGVASVGHGAGAVQSVVYFKITTDHPASVAKVEITFKNKVHLLEFHDAPGSGNK